MRNTGQLYFDGVDKVVDQTQTAVCLRQIVFRRQHVHPGCPEVFLFRSFIGNRGQLLPCGQDEQRLLPEQRLGADHLGDGRRDSAITAWKRVQAGKHFVTDVLVGYAVGALVEY